jgi:hypothetical protein
MLQERLLARLQHLRDAQIDSIRNALSQVAVVDRQAEGHPALLTVASRSGTSSVSCIRATSTGVSVGTG